jgi:hypothetical protein
VFRLLAQRPAKADQRIPLTWLHQLELPNALQLMVLLARSGTGLRMTPENASAGLAHFDDDLSSGQFFALTPIATYDLVQETRALSLRHTARHRFRAYDIAHVASALLLECDAFWSFDAKASKLAKLEGLKTL